MKYQNTLSTTLSRALHLQVFTTRYRSTGRIALALMLAASANVHAHPGGVDKNGGHVDKSTGKYHCHRADCVVPSSDRVKRDQVRTNLAKFRRADWGGWKDADDDCQDSRSEVLQRDSLVAVTFRNGKTCAVVKGQWHDPYTGDDFELALSLDIDHIVPLEWANNHGGSSWTNERKQNFTNELANLLAVGAGVNRDKGAAGPDRWLPPEQSFRCFYLAKFLHVYDKYKLQFTAAEIKAVTPLATSCDLQVQ